MSNNTIRISYGQPGSLKTADLIYVIIGAKVGDKWIFVRHKDRQSWELPAGHIEKNESPDEAAIRELYEETGTVGASLESLYDYTIVANGRSGSGRLYYAEVTERIELPDSEIAEIQISNTSPEPATYPEAHRSFLEVLEKHHQRLVSRGVIPNEPPEEDKIA
ncbi:NUDIX domain-containing protein [Bacteroidota bacterium]